MQTDTWSHSQACVCVCVEKCTFIPAEGIANEVRAAHIVTLAQFSNLDADAAARMWTSEAGCQARRRREVNRKRERAVPAPAKKLLLLLLLLESPPWAGSFPGAAAAAPRADVAFSSFPPLPLVLPLFCSSLMHCHTLVVVTFRWLVPLVVVVLLLSSSVLLTLTPSGAFVL